MDENAGVLLVMMEPAAGAEDEFNDWYDTEHFLNDARYGP
jgi:hypothetical protein